YHNLNELVTDLADLTGKILPRRMRFTVDLPPDALPVYLDAVEFRQVMIGLVLNALEAMPPDGHLVFRTSARAQLSSGVNYHGIPPRLPAVCLSVQDSGRGIPARHLANVFDPFFTTKPANKGSGLGLHSAELFAEKHRGAISLESAEGAG